MRTLTLLLLLINTAAWTQLDSRNSLFQENSFFLNPGRIAAHENLNGTVFYRSQWAGFGNDLGSGGVSVTVPARFNSIGIGAGFYQDKEEESTVSTFLIGGAYRINFLKGTLSYGMQFGLQQFKQNLDQFSVFDESDQVLQLHGETISEINAGAHYESKFVQLFISGRHLNQGYFLNNEESRQRRHIYFGGAYLIPLNNSISLRPKLLARFVNGLPAHIQVGASLEKGAFYQVGLQVTTNADLIVNVGINLQSFIGQELSVFYAYDLGLGRLAAFHNGSHEIVLNYVLNKRPSLESVRRRKSVKSPVDFGM